MSQQDVAELLKRPKKHFIWKLFNLTASGTQCILCGKLYSLSTGVTTLRYHSVNHHKLEYRKEEKRSEDDEKAKKTLLELVCTKGMPPTENDDKLARLFLAKALVESNTTVSLLNNMWFRLYHSKVAPSFKLPSGKTMTREIDNLFVHSRTELMKRVSKAKIVMSSDGWTSRNGNHHVYSLILYHMDDSFHRRTEISALKAVSEQTSESLKDVFVEMFDELGVNYDHNLLGAMTDGAYSIRKAIRLLGVESLRCAAHCVQLIAAGTAKHELVSTAIEKSKRLVALLHRSSSAKAEFDREVLSADMETKTIRSFSITRWLASSTLLSDVQEFAAVFKAIPVFHTMIWTAEEESAATYYCKIAAHLQDCLNEFEKSSSTLCSTIPWLYHAQKKVLNSKEYLDQDNCNHSLAILFNNMLTKRIDEFAASNLHVAAVLFDPRIFMCATALPENLKWSNVKQSVIELYVQYEEHCRSVHENTEEPTKKKPNLSTDSFWDSLHGNNENDFSTRCDDPIEALQAELVAYETECVNSRPTKSLPIFDFWKDRQTKYLHLSQLAKIVLSFPCSSADNERLFSVSGSILSEKKRARMHTDTLEKLLIVGTTDFVRYHEVMLDQDAVYAAEYKERNTVPVFDPKYMEIIENKEQESEELLLKMKKRNGCYAEQTARSTSTNTLQTLSSENVTIMSAENVDEIALIATSGDV